MELMQGLTRIVKCISSPMLRRVFLCEWLEDINFHKECAQLGTKFTQIEQDTINFMEGLRVLANEKHYSKSHFDQLHDYYTDEHKKALDQILKNGYYQGLGIRGISKELFFDYLKITSQVSTFNYIYGWCAPRDMTVESLELLLSQLTEKEEAERRAYSYID